MNLSLTEEQAGALREVLDNVLGELSSEIAGTDNASFRASLEARRHAIRDIRAQLGPG